MEKKKRDYILLLVFMVLSYMTITIVPRLFPSDGVESLTANDVVISLVMIVWYIFCYRVTSNFYYSKWIRGLYSLLLIFQLSLTAYVNSQVGAAVDTLVIIASIAYTANLLGFSLVFYILLKDIFLQKHDLTYSLLGASNIYFMFPILFSYLYALVAVHEPSLVNAGMFDIKSVLFNCFDYSWFVVASIDYPQKIGEVIQKMAILESISANLFIVFIIGRLMSK